MSIESPRPRLTAAYVRFVAAIARLHTGGFPNPEALTPDTPMREAVPHAERPRTGSIFCRIRQGNGKM